MFRKSRSSHLYMVMLSIIQSLLICIAPGAALAQNYQVVNNSSVQGGAINNPNGNTYVLNMTSSSLNLSGNLSNYGRFYVVSTNPALTSATISANNIYNYNLLTTIVPPGGLPGLQNLVSGLNLNLLATNNLVNQGVISSAGSLMVQAPNIFNSGLMNWQAGCLNAYTANLVNSGVMQAINGSMNIKNPWGNTLEINNAGGKLIARDNLVMQTLASVTDSNSKMVSQALLHVTGGLLSAQQIYFNSPNGKVDVSVDQIAGTANVNAGTAALGAAQGNVQIGQVNVTGDPLFYAQSGNLDISGLFTSSKTYSTGGTDFTALAQGNISAKTAPSGATITAQSATQPGGAIYLNSGINFTISSGGYQLLGPSGSGGNINLGNVGFVTNNNSFTALAHSGNVNYGTIQLGDILVCCQGGAFAKAATVTINGPGTINIGNVINDIGAVNVTSTANNIILADQKVVEAFGADVALNAARLVQLGHCDIVNAVNGDVLLTGENINFGGNNDIAAFANGTAGVGNVIANATRDITSSGRNNIIGAGGSIQLLSQNGAITTGSSDVIKAKAENGAGGAVSIKADNGSVNIGTLNEISAVGNNLTVRSALAGSGNVNTGDNTSLNGFGGDVSIVAPVGNVTVGSNNEINSVGGNLSVGSALGTTTGTGTRIGAFGDQAGNGGFVSMTAPSGPISIGTNNAIDSVGGSITIKMTPLVQLGDGSKVTAVGQTGNGGNVDIVAGSEVLGTGVSVRGTKAVNLQSSAAGGISTGTVTTIQAADGSVTIAAQTGPVNFGGGTISATGGDVNVTSALDLVQTGTNTAISAFEKSGIGGNVTVSAPNNKVALGSANTVNAVGGDATISATTTVIGDSTKINAFAHSVGGNVNVSGTNDVTLGQSDVLSAVGGDVSVTGGQAGVTSGGNSQFNAYAANSTGGSVTISAPGDVTLGATNKINAVGGNATVKSTSGSLNLGNNSAITTYQPSTPLNGDITVESSKALSLSNSTLQAANGVSVTSDTSGISFTNERVYAGTDTSGGSITITTNGNGDLVLNASSHLRAYLSLSMYSSGNVYIGLASGGNTLCAQTGDVSITANNDLRFGTYGDTVKSVNGGITLVSNNGNLQLGIRDLISAGGGDVTLTSALHNVLLGSNNKINAFYNLAQPTLGGNIIVNALNGSIYCGVNNDLNAVGGSIYLNSPNIDLGTGNHFCTFDSQTSSGGKVELIYPVETTLSGLNLTVEGDIVISAPGLTLENDTLIAVGGDLSLTSTSILPSKSLFIDEGNVLEAFSTAWLPGYSGGAVKGGNVYLNSLSDIVMFHSEGIGGPSLPDEPPVNYIQAVNGNIVLNANNAIHIFNDNVFVASKRLPDGTCGPDGGGVYFFTDGAGVSPLPLPGPLNEFFFTDQKVTIEPSPSTFYNAGPTVEPIYEISKSGGDESYFDIRNGGAVKLLAEDSLIHVLSSDFVANNGIVYFRTGGEVLPGGSSDYEIQFKDSAISAGCVPIIPPPPVCPKPPRPVCPAPPTVQPPVPPTEQVAPPAPIGATPPSPPDFPNPPNPTPCPPVPPGPTPTPAPSALIPPTTAAVAQAVTEVSIPLTPQALELQLPVIARNDFAYYVVDVKESYLQATSGTKLLVASRKRVQMKDGEMIVRAGHDDLTVEAGDAAVELKPTQIASIESRTGEPTTIVALAAADAKGIPVNIRGHVYMLKPGEMILVNDLMSGLSERVAQVGASTEKPTERLDNIYVMRASLSLPEYLPKMVFLNNRECPLRNYLYNGAIRSQTALAAKGSRAHPNKPIALAMTSIPSIVRSTTNLRMTEIASGHYAITLGAVLVHATRDLRLDTPQGTALIKNGAVALVSASRDISRVRDLSDDWNGGVKVVIGRRSTTLAPGKEIDLVRPDEDPLPYVLSDGISRRAINISDVDGMKVVQCDFSIVHAMLSHPLLSPIRQSVVPTERRLYAETLKSAAALNMIVDRSKGPYYVPETADSSTGLVVKPIEPVF